VSHILIEPRIAALPSATAQDDPSAHAPLRSLARHRTQAPAPQPALARRTRDQPIGRRRVTGRLQAEPACRDTQSPGRDDAVSGPRREKTAATSQLWACRRESSQSCLGGRLGVVVWDRPVSSRGRRQLQDVRRGRRDRRAPWRRRPQGVVATARRAPMTFDPVD